jgi:hypothetical protein
MSRQAYIRSSVAIAAMDLIPQLVREALISDSKFRENYGVTVDAVLSFGNSSIKFQRSGLLDGVRRAFDMGATGATVNDMSEQAWTVEFLPNEDPPKIALTHDKKRLLLTHFALLSPDRGIRLRAFRHEANDVNLPLRACERWEALLESRPPDDDELVGIQDDLRNTPVGIQNAIRENLSSGAISLDVLVPRSEQYYERLVGKYVEGQTFDEFVRCVAAPHMDRLIKWRAFEGYQLALLLASQPTLSAALGTLELKSTELARVYGWLASCGDACSRAAAIESGLSQVQDAPDLQEPLRQLIGAVLIDEVQSAVDPYKLLSAIIIAVYGEIAYTRALSSKPPYWRRLAAIAQSILIARCVIANGNDANGLVEWLMAVRARMFLLQCYVDMRLEPRWLPDLILRDQLKNELVGRIYFAASKHAKAVVEAGWKKLLFDDSDGSLRKQFDLALACLPGPIEGGTTPTLEIPAAHLAEMRSDLAEPVISAASLSGLVNGSLLFLIPAEIADMAADAIARADYRLECVDEQTSVVPCLLGIASMASITRNHKLADALFTLLRKYRQFYPQELSFEDSFRIAMIASASRTEFAEWCKCVGDFVTELAFRPVTKEEAVRLHSHVIHLCHLVPELWASCGQAEAALQSVVNI